ncbi:hypothetical protein [Euzebya pacifica]|nr:hypothetical protein [Euzebya pacifica]
MTPTFSADIRPLFRAKDVSAMSAFFDLHSYTDVVMHADSILQRIEDGSMPCDLMWSDQQVALFADWLAAGMPE